MNLPLANIQRENCGSCSLCCKLMAIPEIDKGEDIWCSHVDHGCSIYRDRPKACRSFRCHWLMSHEDLDKVPWPLLYRPDKSHVIFANAKMTIDGEVRDCIGVHVDPDYPNAWMETNVSGLIQCMRDNNISVFVKGVDVA